MSSPADIQFGKLAIALGFMTREQLATCLQFQEETSKSGKRQSLADLCLEKKYLTEIQCSLVAKSSQDSGESKLSDTINSRKLSDTINSGKQFGRYKILEEIGRGGMGRVYKAYDSQLNRVVALKMLISGDNEEDVARFLREVKTTASLTHPNIVSLYDFGEQDGQLYFTMAFLTGHTLQDVMKKSSLTIRHILEIMGDVAKAVQYAHEQGIIHRDLKPSNIMVESENEVKVMDFGLAKAIEESQKISKSGTVIGTLQYMPPEQAEGRLREIDVRSDVYALGVILYEMLTKSPPFVGKSFTQESVFFF